MNCITVNQNKALDWNQRPKKTNNLIDKCFDRVRDLPADHWPFNGAPKYCICGVDEHEWFIAFIKNAYPKRKRFCAMDIGAGNFSWAKALSQRINQDSHLPHDISISIISLRGEPNPNQESFSEGKCYLLNLGAFKIENLFEEFTHRNFDFENNADLIVASMTFQHLVDPVGMLAQLLPLLQPITGLLLMDPFPFLYQNQTVDLMSDPENYKNNIVQLLFTSNVPFLMKNCGLLGSQFALFKSLDTTPFPLEYLTTFNFGAFGVTQFKADYFLDKTDLLIPNDPEEFFGDPNLYEELSYFIL